MSPSKPDAATLDAMILGGVEDDLEAWEWLVSTPDADEAWATATRRRRRLDRVATAIQGRPWLARLTSSILAYRPAAEAPELESVFVVGALEAALRDTGAVAESIAVQWGSVTTRSVRVGQTLRLRTQTQDEHVRCFYRWHGGEGNLSSGWTLEPGEAPVLLLACLNASDVSTVERAVATAGVVTGVLLVETHDGDSE